jgi:hypothetical protein
MLMGKIKKAIWTGTSSIYGLQAELVGLSNKPTFPVKDPGHFIKLKALVGEEKEQYNSRVNVKIVRKPSKPSPGTP